MKFKMLFISVLMLFCLAAQIFTVINIASADGCGVNPLGDTSGDTDFYVSKNQNSATSGGAPSPGASTETRAAVPLGTSVEQKKGNVTIESLNPDRISPQKAGSTIVWTANATNPDNVEMVYNFFLKGSATNDELIEKTGWIAENRWTWNTSEADIGENQVQVWVKRLGAEEAENSKVQNYTISAEAISVESNSVDNNSVENNSAATSDEQVADEAASTKKSTLAEMNPHPGGKTANSVVGESSTSKSSTTSSGMNGHPGGKTANIDVSKPRLAPDERNSAASAGALSDGPIMSTQDPSTLTSDIMDVGGKWTIDLIGSGCTLDITLIQTGESITGLGNLIERNMRIPQTVKGTVTSNTLGLKSQAVIDEFGNDIDKSVNLNLEKTDRSISGSYEMYSGDELMAKGNATASRFSS